MAKGRIRLQPGNRAGRVRPVRRSRTHSAMRERLRGARPDRAWSTTEVRFSQPGRLLELTRSKGIRTRQDRESGNMQVRHSTGRLIATRTNAAGRPILPKVRRTMWYRDSPGYPTRFRRSPPRIVGSAAAVGTTTSGSAARVEGGGGGTNPSQKAYRNSAQYRERHGLAAGA